MNEEIKEILDYFQKDIDKYEESKRYLTQEYGYDEEKIDNISQHKRHINTKKLLDYITNLQKENEKIKHFYFDLANKYENLIEKYLDYKSRNEKAIEYIKLELTQGGPREIRDLVDGYELLNILQGGDE